MGGVKLFPAFIRRGGSNKKDHGTIGIIQGPRRFISLSTYHMNEHKIW